MLANANAVLENWIADFESMRRTTEWGMIVFTFPTSSAAATGC
jgi:peptidoglycan-N-acetylglucosamine deacetylase